MSIKQSSYDLKVDSVLRVTPVTSYDPFEAKFCASLYWLVFRATEDGGLDDIPPQITSPLERDAEHRITVRPEVIELLTSADVYGKVCGCIFNNKEPVIGHWAVVQCLSRHGFYVVEDGDIAVTDSTLQQIKPFRKSTHLALMDALMSAYSSKVVTIPQVVQAVRRFAPFNASKELPFDLEDALLLWLNKVSSTLNDKEINKQKLHAENLLRDQDKAKRFRFRRDQLQPKVQTMFPVIDDLLKGISDGQCLLGVVMYYHGDSIKLEDIKFGQDLCQEDIVHNIEQFRSLCSQYICTTSLSLQVEDLMYSSHAMKSNLIALLAEIFYKCELEDDTITDDKKTRSQSVVNMTVDPSDSTIKDGFTTNNFASNRSSSAPMLASEIIATRSPSVGRKLRDFAKEKNQQRYTSNPDQLVHNSQDKENATPRNSENQPHTDRTINTRSYSLQLDFTDEKDLISNAQETQPDTGNPFSGIFQKPKLATRKHSAPERVGEPSPRVMPKVEPRLNRRAKQKPRTLALEDWEMEDKDDIQVTDLQRSQSLTGLDNKSLQPRQSFHAWQEDTSTSDPNLDLNTMKSQRISLDFRPIKSHSRDILPNKSSLYAADKHREEHVSDDSLLSCSPASADSLSGKPSPASKRKEIPVVSQSTISENELKEFEEMEAIVLAQRSNESNKNTELSDDDVLNSSVSSDDMNRFRLEVLQRLTSDKIKTLEKQQSVETKDTSRREQLDARVENQSEPEEEGVSPPEDREEELLSPINESSEPLHSTGSLPDTHSLTPSTTPSSPCSPLDVAPFTPEFFMTSPANTLDKKAYKRDKAHKEASKSSRDNLEAKPSGTPRLETTLVPHRDHFTPRNKSVEVLARGSYTMDQITMDAAKAAGIPVIGSESIELINPSIQSRLARTTMRSLSVPEPLDIDRTIGQVPSLHNRSSGSSSLIAGQSLYNDPSPRPSYGHTMKSPFGTHAVSQEEMLQDVAAAARHFSPQPPDDVVIYDRRTNTHYDARDRTARDHHVDSNTALASSYPGYHEAARQSFVERGLVHDSRGDSPVYVQHGGMGPNDHRHDCYPEQFAAAVSERLLNHSQRSDQVDASHVRTSQYHEPLRDSYVRNSFIPPNADRSSIIDSFVNQDARSSLVCNQGPDLRYAPVSNAAMEPSPTPYTYGSVEPGNSLEPRTVYSDQYGTYVKSSKSHNVPHGQYHMNATPMYNHEVLQQGYSSPRQAQERHTSPGQFATFRKSPGPPVINRHPAPSPGYHYDQQVSTNQMTTSHSNFQTTAGIPLVHQANWNYPQAPTSIESAVSQQYSSSAHALADPSFQASNYHPRPSMQAFQTTPGRHSGPGTPTNGEIRYQAQGYDGNTMQMREVTHPTLQNYRTDIISNQQPPQETQRSRTSSIDSVSRDREDPRNQSHTTLQSYRTEMTSNHSSPQETQRSRTSSMDSVSRDREDPRNQPHPTLQSYRTEMTSNHLSPQETQRSRTYSPPQEAQRSRTSSVDSKKRDDDIDTTPERKSQAFTVDLDTGEFKEFNSSSDSISPRSPGSTVIRSRTFRKGREERVFGYDPKSLPGQQNKGQGQDTGTPQPSSKEPEVVRKNTNPSTLVTSTSWSESAEALKAVLYNGFTSLNKDNEVVPSPHRRTNSPRTTSPAARVTWLTAGRNSFGGQVMLNEKEWTE